MATRERIEHILTTALQPEYLEVIDQSHLHAGHAGARESGGGHFVVSIVSPAFEQKSRLQRHRLIHDLLSDEFAGAIHALSIQAFTPHEWNDR